MVQRTSRMIKASFDFDAYGAARTAFSRDEWLNKIAANGGDPIKAQLLRFEKSNAELAAEARVSERTFVRAADRDPRQRQPGRPDGSGTETSRPRRPHHAAMVSRLPPPSRRRAHVCGRQPRWHFAPAAITCPSTLWSSSCSSQSSLAVKFGTHHHGAVMRAWAVLAPRRRSRRRS